MWPDNEQAYVLFRRVGTRWALPPMGGVPMEAMYPLMDRMGLDADDWNDLHDCLMVMECEAIATMHELAPKGKE
ncbi:DUF1799 domain-containing protein [Delftia acidovorans]|nr:DUF1799 domain-containing protein [Delftia acidovorans]